MDWIIYVGNTAKLNMHTGLELKTWGHKTIFKSIQTEEIQENDIIYFVVHLRAHRDENGNKPSGFPRVDASLYNGTIDSLITCRVTKSYYFDDKNVIWDDDHYPHRYGIELLDRSNDLEFGFNSFGEEFVQAVRESAMRKGSPIPINRFTYPYHPNGTSWILPNDVTAIKSADITLITEYSTCIPKNIICFFIGTKLKRKESKQIVLFVKNKKHDVLITRRQDGRYKIHLNNIRELLNLKDFNIDSDEIWFVKRSNAHLAFDIYTKTGNKSFSIRPNSSKPQKPKSGDRTRRSETEIRVGQAYFKSEVSDICNNRCVVTGVEDLVPSILIGSHIKSWKDSNDDEKLDGYNGLLLAPHIDKLFDKHQITFDENGKIIALNNDIKNILDCWGIDINQSYSLTKSHQKYLKHHREKFNSK